MLYSVLGVLAYDELADRVQCAVCGRWYQAINAMHLRTHGLTVDEYKEAAGLNVSTPLLTPRIQSLQRQKALAQQAQRQLIKLEKGQTPERAERERYLRRAQYRREHWSPAARQLVGEARRTWTDAAILEALRAMQAARGGRLRLRDLKDTPRDVRGDCPSHTAVIERFGSWRRVCQLLDQPYYLGRGKGQGAERRWTEDAMLDALRTLRQELGGELTAGRLVRLRSGAKGKAGRFPSYKTVLDHFGSWARVAQLLDEEGTVTPEGTTSKQAVT